MRLPSATTTGVSIIVTPATMIMNWATSPGRMPSASATPTTMKANSPDCDNKNPTCTATERGCPKRRAKTPATTPLSAISPMTDSTTQIARSATAAKSTLMPTVMKNRPSKSPLNGWMSVSTWWRNSVSASSRPAKNAPSAIDSPAMLVRVAIPNVTRSVVATKSSALRVPAITRNSGCSARRPTK